MTNNIDIINAAVTLIIKATVTQNTVELSGRQFNKITTPTPLQQKALNLLKVRL